MISTQCGMTERERSFFRLLLLRLLAAKKVAFFHFPLGLAAQIIVMISGSTTNATTWPVGFFHVLKQHTCLEELSFQFFWYGIFCKIQDLDVHGQQRIYGVWRNRGEKSSREYSGGISGMSTLVPERQKVQIL